jgi:hypothetical protein
MQLLSFLLISVVVLTSAAFAADADRAGTGSQKKLLHHVVLLKFKQSASPEQIKKVEDAFAALKQKVPGVVSLHWGTNVSPEHLNKGFTHCFTLAFNSDKDRDAYLVAPAHKDFGKILGPVMEEVLVIDFWSND